MTDLNTRVPTGNDVTQRTVMKPAFSDDLLEAILNRANLQQAYSEMTRQTLKREQFSQQVTRAAAPGQITMFCAGVNTLGGMKCSSW